MSRARREKRARLRGGERAWSVAIPTYGVCGAWLSWPGLPYPPHRMVCVYLGAHRKHPPRPDCRCEWHVARRVAARGEAGA